jgi:hypothetical protein
VVNLITIPKKSIAALLLAFLASAMLPACSSDLEEAPPSEAGQSQSQWGGTGNQGENDAVRDEICDEADLGPGNCPE